MRDVRVWRQRSRHYSKIQARHFRRSWLCVFAFCVWKVRSCAVALFGISKPHFSPAAAWYCRSFCVRFFRTQRGKTAHAYNVKYRSAEGSARQLRKS